MLNRRMFIINSPSNAGGPSCFVVADRVGIYLLNDANAFTGYGNGTNNQCTLNSGGVSNSGAISTLTVSITFKPSFAGPKTLYMYADDIYGNGTGFVARGTYTAFSAPSADSVNPSSGSGNFQTFSAVFSNPAGAAYLNRRMFVINSPSNAGGPSCFVVVDPTGVYLLSDTNSFIGYGNGMNSQCTLASSSITNTGTTSTLTLSISFKSQFAGSKNIYMYAEDLYGNNTGFVMRGTYTTQ